MSATFDMVLPIERFSCDADAVLDRVVPAGPACHNGTTSCFREDAVLADVFATLDATITSRMQHADNTGTSYTRKLLGDRNLRLKKLGEEAVELATACVDGDIERATEETADLLYHALVALRAVGGSLDGVRAVLSLRAT
jgi:phosphoribosyl-ATP pyrophosphohydrolase/phosphoribosyl-AMP cyclohydrolase